MTRHGKNATASAVYSYSERKKDARESGYGTLQERLGADSFKEFDCCSLTLQPCRDPVITPNGYIFDRQAVLEYILAQKKEITKKTKEWERQVAAEEVEREKDREAERERQLREFEKAQMTLAPRPAPAPFIVDKANPLKRPPTASLSSEFQPKVKRKENEGDLSNMKGELSEKLTSFWIPELNPTASASKVEKPTQKVLCPLSGRPLKLKELMPVEFTPIADGDNRTSMIAKKVRYMCPVTHDALTNSMRLAYLKTSKKIVTWTCVEKIIKKEMIDPVSGVKMTDDDIIEVARGGTGFAATNDVEAKIVRPQLELQ